jgi:hypothetical protein
MNFQQFAKKHGGLKTNIFRRDAPWSGSLFGSSQEEREYIKNQSQDKVWTLVCDGRDYFLIPGDQEENNKLGNIVTKKSGSEKIQIK